MDEGVRFKFGDVFDLFILGGIVSMGSFIIVTAVDFKCVHLSFMKYPIMGILTLLILSFFYQVCLCYEDKIVIKWPLFSFQKEFLYTDLEKVQILPTRNGYNVVFHFNKKVLLSKSVALSTMDNSTEIAAFFKERNVFVKQYPD